MNLTFSVLSAHRKVIFEKQWFFLDGAVGNFYSTTFEIVSGALQPQKLKNTDSFTGVCSCFDSHTPDTSPCLQLAFRCVMHSFISPDCTQWPSESFSFFIFTLSHLSASLSFPDAKEAGTDNRNIVDDGKSQKLTRDDIEDLKEKGLEGQVQKSPCSYDHKWESIAVLPGIGSVDEGGILAIFYD